MRAVRTVLPRSTKHIVIIVVIVVCAGAPNAEFYFVTDLVWPCVLQNTNIEYNPCIQ